MKKPVIKKENVVPLLETRFIKVFDLQYEPGAHYFDATRNGLDNITAIKNDNEFRSMLPDAVTCAFIIIHNDEPYLYLSYEYRYPAGQYLLSPPAGLIDPDDRDSDDPLVLTTVRELFEETGINVSSENVSVVVPLVFSSPGFTDESNAITCAVAEIDDLSSIKQTGAVGTENFDGYVLINKKEAQTVLARGTDEHGNYYSAYTWMVLSYFVNNFKL